MQRPSRLARYVADRLQERDETPDEFAKRIGINTSGLYKLLRGAYSWPQQQTLGKIAGGLGMTDDELMRAANAYGEEDPIEQAIRQRTAEMREILDGTPRAFWPAIVRAIFDGALANARILATLGQPPVSALRKGGVSAPRHELTRGTDDSKGVLADSQHALAALAAGG